MGIFFTSFVFLILAQLFIFIREQERLIQIPGCLGLMDLVTLRLWQGPDTSHATSQTLSWTSINRNIPISFFVGKGLNIQSLVLTCRNPQVVSQQMIFTNEPQWSKQHFQQKSRLPKADKRKNLCTHYWHTRHCPKCFQMYLYCATAYKLLSYGIWLQLQKQFIPSPLVALP